LAKVSGTMADQLDVPLEDSELLAEVVLTTNLIIAASEAEARLPQSIIDDLLGLELGAVTRSPEAVTQFPAQKNAPHHV
jgi:hypothetical protein